MQMGWLVGVFVMVAVMAVSIAGLLASRRAVQVEELRFSHDVGGYFISAIGGIYGVLLALVVVSVWEDFTIVKMAVSREGGAISDLARVSIDLPDDSGTRLRVALQAYAQSVVDHEWTAMANGQPDDHTENALHALWRAVTREIDVSTPVGKTVLSFALDRLGALSENRAHRVVASGERLPDVLWVVLVLGGCVTIAFTYLFGAAKRLQVVMTAALASQIGMALFLVLALDNPFSGAAVVDDVPIRRALFVIAEMDRGR